MIFKAGDSLTKFPKLIPVSEPGSALNNVGRGLCATTENDVKIHKYGYSNAFLIMAVIQ